MVGSKWSAAAAASSSSTRATLSAATGTKVVEIPNDGNSVGCCSSGCCDGAPVSVGTPEVNLMTGLAVEKGKKGSTLRLVVVSASVEVDDCRKAGTDVDRRGDVGAGVVVVVVDVVSLVHGFRTILVKTTRLRDPGLKFVRHLI